MAKINDNYLKLKAGYLFPEIGRRVREFSVANPSAKVIRLGIGDVTRPLAPAVIKAFHDAVDDLASMARVREAFNPSGVLNPGKLLPGNGEREAVRTNPARRALP